MIQTMKTKQCGFSMIELLVAVFLGIFISTGVVQIYASSKQTYQVQDEQSRMQEAGRATMHYISHFARLAGYRGDLDNYLIEGWEYLGDADPIDVVEGVTNSDELVIRFQSDGLMDNCAGDNVTGAGPVSARVGSSEFKVVNNNLECNGIVIAENVQSFQVLFGVDNDRDGTADRYATSSASIDPEGIVSLRVSLLLQSLDDNMTDRPRTFTFDLDNDGFAETTTPTDRRLRRSFSTTVAVRNIVL